VMGRAANRRRSWTCWGSAWKVRVMAVLSDSAHRIAPETCRTRMTNPTGTHFRPKATGKQRRRLVAKAKQARLAATRIVQARRSGEPALDEQALVEETFKQNMDTLLADMTKEGGGGEPCPEEDALQMMQRLERSLTAKKKAIDKAHKLLGLQQAEERQQTLLQQRPKQAHKQVFQRQPHAQRCQLEAVIHPATGRPTTRPEVVVGVTHKHFAEKGAPPTGVKTGAYLPAEAPRNYPWERPGTADRFTLETGATRLSTRPWLLQRVRDEQRFFQCCRRLSNGKAPGPDDITNEVLAMMPVEVKQVLHRLFVLMWATGCTPEGWKESTTCLLYKKGSAMDAANYRPIGLANTVYKLWTSVVQRVMYEYAESHAIISEMQSGFRQRTSRHRPLQLLLMMIEDAELTAQDLYTLQVDFSAAFNMSDHDLQLQIMYDLGFPTDAIEVVKDLYTGATTRYQTPHGPTPPVQINRGTMQGDSLSPFLFLLYIEPLLRWLNVGGRGYAFGAVPETDKDRTRCASLAYADDLQITTSNITDMHAQAQKLTDYSNWAHMAVNAGKTFASGILHKAAADFGGGHKRINGMLEKRLAQVQVQGQNVAYMPPEAPFLYLGVTMTLTLDWRHNFDNVIRKAKEQAQSLYRSLATGGQVVKMAETVVRPGISSSFGVAPFTPLHIRLLDSVMAGIYKRAYRQRTSTPTAAVHEDVNRFGMGCTSLLVTYAQEGVKQITEAYNEAGAYGIVTRSLLQHQTRVLGGLSAEELGKVAMRHLRIRQLSAAEAGKLRLVNVAESKSVCLAGTDLYNVVTAVREAAGEQLARAASHKIMVPLLSLGIRHITDVLSHDCTAVMTLADVRLKFGSRRVKTKHANALYKLSYLLHQAEPTSVCTDKRLLTAAAVESRGARHIATNHVPVLRAAPYTEQLSTLQNMIAPPKHTAQVKTIPDALSDWAKAEPCADTLTLDLTHKPLKKRAQHTPAAVGHRDTILSLGPDDAPHMQQQARTYHTRSERAELLNEPAQRLALLPTLHNLVEHIAADRACNAHTDKASRKRRQAISSQRQYLVQWQPTIEEQWSLEAHVELGYVAAECTPITFAELEDNSGLEAPEMQLHKELYDRITCELCDGHKRTEALGDLLLCDDCNRMYHTACANIQPEDVPEEWRCECCLHGTAKHRARHLHLVKWEPHWEPASAIPTELVNEYARQKDKYAISRAHKPRQMPMRTPLSNLQAQGIYAEPSHKEGMSPDLASLFKVTHKPVNPHTDIAPAGRIVVEVRQVQARYPGKAKRPAVDATYTAACVYGPDGRCVGQLEPARLYNLSANFQHVARAHPELCDQLQPGTFEEEMYKLMLRYKHTKGDKETKSANWAIPTEVAGVLITHLGVEKERMASPLTYDMRMVQYWSVHERDQLFGASWDAFSCKWTGYSECSPKYEHRDMEKAVRWAVHSAASTREPTVTVLVLPDWSVESNTAYRRWLAEAPSYCHGWASITSRCFQFRDIDAWKGAPEHNGHQRWGVSVLLVANIEGFNELQARVDHGAFQDDLTRAISAIKDPKCWDAGTITDIEIHVERNMTDRPTPPLTRIPDKFSRLQSDGAPGPSLPDAVGRTIPAGFRASHALLMDWQDVVYTDGSVTGAADSDIPTRAGSGIYKPGRSGLDPVEIMLDPAGQGMTNTINRAELAPILHALQHDLGATIASDSACSLYQIARYIREPGSMERHVHKPLLEMIAASIMERCRAGQPTHLMKVMAHSGVVGNEHADELAKAAGEQEETGLAACPAAATTPMHALYWPVYEMQASVPDGEVQLRHVQDLRKHLKQHLHHEFRLGYAKKDGIYFNAWQATVPAAHASCSNGFLALPTGVDASKRRLVLQARYGQLNTAKFRMRCNLAKSDACLLCGEPDGGHHSLSGCKHMLEMYTLRHNEAGGIILRTLVKGGLGASLVMQDIGKHNAAGGDPELAATIPTRLPASITELLDAAEPGKNSRPDMVFAHQLDIPWMAELHVVEIKYCRDTDRERQRAAGAEQHQHLIKQLKLAFPEGKVHMHVITLGVTGTIYKDMLEMLETMQVPKREATRCASKLHIHAVQYVQRIMQTKWSQEYASRFRDTG
jgi:ribonuclease HI